LLDFYNSAQENQAHLDLRPHMNHAQQKEDWGSLNADEIEELYRILSECMPGRVENAKGPKGQPNPFRACISCILSAQSRDANTAAATSALFKLARTPRTILQLTEQQIAEAIKPCGLYNVKARNIRKFCKSLLADFGGAVPDSRKELMKLPGIGRKCADIVLQFTLGVDTIAVDTHVHRVCNRTGLARGKNEAQTAQELEDRSPQWAMREGHFWLIQFGKKACVSRAPDCSSCPIHHLCRHYRVHGVPTQGRMH
jgi:endonuclease-3